MNLKVLFIIIDAQPDLQSADNDIKMQQQWKFKSTLKGTFFWNNNCGRFDLRNSKNVSDKALYRLIKEINKELDEGLTENHIHSFEIWSVCHQKIIKAC